MMKEATVAEDVSSAPFVCAYLLDGSGRGQRLDASGVGAWSEEQGVLWVHLDILDAEAREWAHRHGELDSTIVEALLVGETRPRVVPSDDGLLLVLRGVNTNPGADPEDMVSIRLWIEPHRIITSRRRQLLSVQDMRDALDAGNGPRTSGEFLVALVEKIAVRIGHAVERIDDELDQAETEVTEKNAELSAALGSLRRQTAAIRRYLAPQRDALDRLYRQPSTLLSDTESHELREQADQITRSLEDLDLARERAMVVQEELFTRLAHEQNSRVYLLSVVAALFLPLTFVTGLLGMNVGGLPGIENPQAFVLSLFIMGVMGAGLLLYFRFKKWI